MNTETMGAVRTTRNRKTKTSVRTTRNKIEKNEDGNENSHEEEEGKDED